MVDEDYYKEYIGKRFGMLVVVSEVKEKGKLTKLLCKCDCGNEKLVIPSELKAGNVQSCNKGHRNTRITDEKRSIRKLELKEYQILYRKNNAQKISKIKNQYRDKIKNEGIQRYGGKCQCCGETTKEFLTMEHINGRDKNVKKKTGKLAWAELKSKGWPDGITILCFNCNCAKGAFGYCPHQTNKL